MLLISIRHYGVMELPELTMQLLSPPQSNDHKKLHKKEIHDKKKMVFQTFFNPIIIDTVSNMHQISQMLLYCTVLCCIRSCQHYRSTGLELNG
jgi:hypothetical protein